MWVSIVIQTAAATSFDKSLVKIIMKNRILEEDKLLKSSVGKRSMFQTALSETWQKGMGNQM